VQIVNFTFATNIRRSYIFSYPLLKKKWMFPTS